MRDDTIEDDMRGDDESLLSRRSCLKGTLAVGGALGLGAVGLGNPVAAQTDGLSVTDLTNADLTAENLAESLVAEGVGVEISPDSVTYTGDERAGGTFTGGDGILGFDEGIVLSSGQAADAVGPNESASTTTTFGTDGDPDLDELANGTTSDAAILEFEFTVPGDVDEVTFNYVFGSEEYNEYVGSEFNDVFAFYVNGENCAVVEDPEDPDETVPVSINTINNGQPGTEPTNPDLYVNNDPFNADSTGETVSEDDLENTEMDGFTTVLKCNHSVNPGESNTMRLAIADTGDASYDSWVFLQAGSLTSAEPTVDDVSVTCAQATVSTANIDEGETLTVTTDFEEGDPVAADVSVDAEGVATVDLPGDRNPTHVTVEYDGATLFDQDVTAEDGPCGVDCPDVEAEYEFQSGEWTAVSGEPGEVSVEGDSMKATISAPFPFSVEYEIDGETSTVEADYFEDDEKYCVTIGDGCTEIAWFTVTSTVCSE